MASNKIILSGNEKLLRPVLTELMALHQMMGDMQSGGSVNRPPISPEFDDYLLLTVAWTGKVLSTNKKHYVEKSVRLKTIDPKTVSLEQLKELAKRVKAKFDGLTFNTGHCRVKYANYKDGFRTWGDFESKEAGYRVIEALGDIVGKSIDRKHLRYEYVDDTSVFDITPSKIPIANKLVRPPVQSPIAAMKFSRAILLFPWIGHTEILCDNKGFTISSLSFLDQYQD